MSRRTYFDEEEREIVVIVDYNKCRYKTNGICYNNHDVKRLGKKCMGCIGDSKWKEIKKKRK